MTFFNSSLRAHNEISSTEVAAAAAVKAVKVQQSESNVWPGVDLWATGPRAKGGKTPNFLCPFRPELRPDRVLFE